MIAILLFAVQAWAAFEQPPLDWMMQSDEAADIPCFEVGYESFYELVGYSHVNLQTGKNRFFAAVSSDEDAIYRELSIGYSRFVPLFTAESFVSVSYLSCSAKGEMGKVGSGRGIALGGRFVYEMGRLTAHISASNLVGTVKYDREKLMDLTADSYYESPSRELCLRIERRFDAYGIAPEIGVWNRNLFLTVGAAPHPAAHVRVGWMFGDGARSGLSCSMSIDLGSLVMRYGYLLNSSGMQSVAINFAIKLKGG